ncbi:FAD-binding oxidoreductase [Cyclobacterium salsum]|uniref:FAD-binding oxidoreductase n=1 Tax=Cyclobacterium salsum TaxID=2666329 RepID=UPI001390E780|nr:FAD-binding oxidoreductase [Cyclobacterium salsum]
MNTQKINEEQVNELKSQTRGEVILPEDAQYDEARALYNGMIDKCPAMIVRCKNSGDVIYSVNFAREHDLLLAIRSGGHNGPGLGTCDGGMMIDLSLMTGVQVDPEDRTATVEAGCTWGDVDHATHAFGLATVSGVISTTGVGGLTLGGGHGYLTRQYGLTIDNLLEADVVLADGRFVKASEEKNEDLFWALRGGGGNFGIVTSFKFKLHPVDTVIAGPLFWPLDQLETTLKWYRDWLPKAPEAIGSFFLLAEIPSAPPFPESVQGKKVCGLMWCHTGSLEESERAIQEAREVAEPLFEHTGPMPYPALQSLFDVFYPKGDQWYWKGDYVNEISDEAIAEHLRFAEVPTPQSCMHLYPINGAVNRVDKHETAWSKRDANWSMVIVGVDADPKNKDKIANWARDYWEALHPHSAGGSYINFLMEEGEERIRGTYGDNYNQLVEIKNKYDPENFFRVNQNIQPKPVELDR